MVHSRTLPLRSKVNDEMVRFSRNVPASMKPGVFASIGDDVPSLIRFQLVSRGLPCASVTLQNTVTFVAFTRATTTAVPSSAVGGIVVNPQT